MVVHYQLLTFCGPHMPTLWQDYGHNFILVRCKIFLFLQAKIQHMFILGRIDVLILYCVFLMNVMCFHKPMI